MSLVRWIDVPQRSAGLLETVVGSRRQSRLVRAAEQFRERLGDRTIWTVSSTSVGGGVAEMLRVLLGYAHDLHVPIRWGVITGDAEFFAVTKRLHNQIHGDASGGPLRADEAAHYTTVLAGNAVELLDEIQPGDLVLLHDPQTAGLAPALASAGARVAWRCPHRRRLGERRDRFRLEFPAALPGRGPDARLLPARVRARLDPGPECRDHPAVHRPVRAEEPAPRRRRGPGDPGPDRRAEHRAGRHQA